MLHEDQYNEPRLIMQLSGGDELAFETLYRKYSPGLYQRLLKIVKSASIAEDILQDVFIIVWNTRNKLDPCKCFRSFLSCIAVHKCYDHFRKISRDKKLFFKLTQSADHAGETNQDYINKEESMILLQTIELLPPKRKIIFRLCKVDGKSYEEVSKELGISLSTISDHIVKANSFIRTRLFPSIS
ncbi:MAG: sigma-70 family RNA polymerase sigma factor [Ferruginibacter sp.]